jgi:predicted carbohydrate-binding protein with CBM5 and CBM33 domain
MIRRTPNPSTLNFTCEPIMKKPRFLHISKLFALLGLLVTQPVFSHGYVSSPQSRAYLCNQGGNTGCGAVQYEPQSVEGPDGYPAGGAQDGTIAAAGSAAWAPLNEQTADRWTKVPIRSGRNSFSWRFTAPHVTKNFVYYITKTNWNPNQPLSRASFDAAPFCTLELNAKPPFEYSHDCVVPERQGYHVILALWDVGDTAATFYNVIDVQFNGANAPSAPTTPTTPTTPGTAQPAPAPKPAPTPTTPTTPVPNCGGGASKVCKAVAGSSGTDQWCNTNCNHNPSFCPTDLCSCESAGSDAPGPALTPAPSTDTKLNCTAVPTGGADNQWCNINCNHNPAFCPTNLCSCE